jgi:hypothetical protein
MHNKFDQSEIYKLKCSSCPKTYIGQTGRSFKTRYKEHIQDIRNNRTKTGFSQHILNTGHQYNNMENCMNIIKIQEKGKLRNTGKILYLQRTKN